MFLQQGPITHASPKMKNIEKASIISEPENNEKIKRKEKILSINPVNKNP